MRFGKTGVAFLKLPIDTEQFSRLSEFPEVIQADQNVDGMGIKSWIHGHIVQQIGETGVLIVPHTVECLRNAPTNMLDGSQCVGNRVGFVIEVIIPIVLTESAGCDANPECTLHLCFDLRNAILVSFVSVAGEEGRVVFLRVMRFQPCAIEGVEGDTDSVRGVEQICRGVVNDCPNPFCGIGITGV